MIKSLKRKVRFAAFDAQTQILVARFYVRRFVRTLKHFGPPATIALIAKGHF